jgi:hypothetical protein
MAQGIKKPARVASKLYDAARGKIKRPLGSYPEIAVECIDAGGSYHNVVRPMTRLLAHLRRRCSSKLPGDIKNALTYAAEQRAEAVCPELSLALSAHSPEHTTLANYIKEKSEELIAEQRVIELAEDRLAEMTAR